MKVSIFDSININSLQIKNRIIRSGTFEYNGRSSNGDINTHLLDYYEALSEGEVGLIITGMMAVDNYSRHYDGMVNIYNPSFVSEFTKITKELHIKDTKIIVQLAHTGIKANLADSEVF